jgi:hypothetical protein
MQDDNGLYYYPFPLNRRVRTYVREVDGAIEFRLWNQDDPKLWDEHGWVPYDAIKAAMQIYEGEQFNPTDAYDLNLARALIKEAQGS